MMAEMNRILLPTALAATIFLTACGTSSRGPSGSMSQTMSGVNPNGYPGGKPVDAYSPALASSSEQLHSRDQDAEKKAEAK
jgi:hypothetical protein